MKYKLLKDLPFINKDNVFEKGSWVGGGWGVDQGTTQYEGGGTSDNGTRTFTQEENNLIDSMLDDKIWIKKIPQRTNEAFELYDLGRYSQNELINWLKETS